MAKTGKLQRLKSVLKKLNSTATNYKHCAASAAATSAAAYVEDDLRAVYVGKSRKLYLLSPSVVNHPLFRELVQRCGEYSLLGPDSKDRGPAPINVGCEVVLFEHFLWMLEDDSERRDQPESVHELIDFYTC